MKKSFSISVNFDTILWLHFAFFESIYQLFLCIFFSLIFVWNYSILINDEININLCVRKSKWFFLPWFLSDYRKKCTLKLKIKLPRKMNSMCSSNTFETLKLAAKIFFFSKRKFSNRNSSLYVLNISMLFFWMVEKKILFKHYICVALIQYWWLNPHDPSYFISSCFKYYFDRVYDKKKIYDFHFYLFISV